jgi:flagellar assembly factor FliW
MLVKTRYFGEIDLNEDKVIEFESGIMGFEEFKKYTILYDVEGDDTPSISWLQSVEEPGLALPVISPLYIDREYDPTVEDELLKPLGEINEDNLAILLIMSVPSDLKNMTVNLKAPLIINSDSKKGRQIIVENQEYEIRYNIYDAIQKMKTAKGAE